MLDPQDRRLLLETLRPPSGFELDHAVGTTYSLDLLALLAAPLAFSLFADGDDPEGDPLVLLEALQANVERITLFCDAGHIYVPPADRFLFAYLEPSVVEAIAPHGGAFHPKIWLLRYTSETETAFRLVCLSRNLTFDCSWDTAIVLEGRVTGRRKRQNTPLAGFIDRLPALAPGINPDRAAVVRNLADEVRYVEWDRPEPFEELTFVPLGHETKPSSWPFADARIDRLLIASPFVAASTLTKLTAGGAGHVLISRANELDGCDPKTVDAFNDVLVLQDEAIPDDDTTSSLRGLHAKLYVADQGWKATVWSGSANATHAAFARNVEFLVELRGPKSHVGIDATLRRGSRSDPGLRDLLTEYEPGEPPAAEVLAHQQLEHTADGLRRDLATGQLCGELTPTGDDLWSFVIRGPALKLPAELVSLTAWPITLREDTYRQTFDASAMEHARFDALATHQISPFIAFAATLGEGKVSVAVAFVFKLSLIGDPEHRRASVTRALLSDRSKVLRYLLYLLAGSETEAMRALTDPVRDDPSGAAQMSRSAGVPLLESLMRTLDRDPRRLAAVRRVVEELRADPEREDFLPDDWDGVWDAIAEVAAEMQS